MRVNTVTRITNRGTPVIHITLDQSEFAEIMANLDTYGHIRQALLDSPDARIIFVSEADTPTQAEPQVEPKGSSRGLLFR